MITIYGDSISGNCLKVKFVAERLNIPYRWVETSVVRRETRTSDFLAINPVGQVPAVVLADGRLLSQSNAIILHLAEGSDLIPGDSYQRAVMFQWLFWEQYNHEPTIATRRFHAHYLKKPESEINPALKEGGLAALARMEGQLNGHSYFVGGRLTLADIALVAYTRFAHEGGFDLGQYPRVRDWVVRIETDLGLDSALPQHLLAPASL
jgi:glutathione S-transferase